MADWVEVTPRKEIEVDKAMALLNQMLEETEQMGYALLNCNHTEMLQNWLKLFKIVKLG